MRAERRRARAHTGITMKTAALSWLITIATLGIFVAVNLPKQKRILLESLDSKARGICASLQDITAGAVVTEDYSSVVDHGRQVLHADPSISFLVITKNDGFALIHEAGAASGPRATAGPQPEPRWRVETLDTSWRPTLREARGKIEATPLIGRRVYHYARPFDYSSIQWGWMHVGLSLDSYDRSVRENYLRTAATIGLCMVIGLFASVVYARMIVRPVLQLQRVVAKVAAGDLSVRADIRSRDEVGGLAQAFNSMTDVVERRELRLRAQNQATAVLATEKTLHEGDLDAAAAIVTETAAGILETDRSSLWLLSADAATLTCLDLYEPAGGIHSSGATMSPAHSPAYVRALAEAPVLAATDAATDPRTSALKNTPLLPATTASLLHASIRLGGQVVGVLCQEHIGEPRDWSLEEQNGITWLADLVALALEAQARHRSQRELMGAMEAAKAASEAKSHFLANMSHEIRTPLNGVVGMLQLIRDGGLPETQHRYLKTALTATDTLLTVINDILDFSKIEAGRLDLEYREFNPRHVVEEIVGALARHAEEKGLDLVCVVAPELPALVRGDDRRVGQVVMNLVGNALKFTQQGKVVVRVSSQPCAEAEVVLQVSVEDTGIGIAPETLRSLFNPFVQGDSSTTRRFGGTGLGLVISRQLAALMGGEVVVSSREGLGSTFVFTARVQIVRLADEAGERHATAPGDLPVLVVDDHAASSGSPRRTARDVEPAAGPGAPAHPLRILVAEDNAINMILISEVLGMMGHLYRCVGTGREAVAELQQQTYDLVLMDCQMPELDGYEATRAIRKAENDRGAGRRTPIIALTAHAMKGDRERCLEAGMDDYLRKPLEVKHLRAAVARWTTPGTDSSALAPSSESGGAGARPQGATGEGS